MNNRSSLFSSLAAALALSGCQSIPQAGLVYASKVNVGLAVEVSSPATAGVTDPVRVVIGYGAVDIAYVPLAVSEASNGKNHVEKIWSSHDELSPNCKNARTTEIVALNAKNANPNDSDRTKSAEQATAAAAVECETRRDAMSVYGQFNGRTEADIAGKKYGLNAGRVFATGMAAQQLTEASINAASAICVDSVKAALGEKATPKEISEGMQMFCRPSKL